MLPSNLLSFFPSHYAAARHRFRSIAEQLSATQWSYPLPLSGPEGELLAIDVARLGGDDVERLVIVSSGLHGVEGFFGSAVQLCLMEQIRQGSIHVPSEVGVLLIHSLNPFGFAHGRRVNEQNVDLNRNFLLPGEDFVGSSAGYDDLEYLLNPPGPPRVTNRATFLAGAITSLRRYGMCRIKQMVAGGQYTYPRGLFFGGQQQSMTVSIVAERLHEWLGNAIDVRHLDLHTGLGRWGMYKLLVNSPDPSSIRASSGASSHARWLNEAFTADDVVEEAASQRTAYAIRGGWGTWCDFQLGGRRAYSYVCVEFGTYAPFRVLTGLRDENQAHFWGTSAQQRVARQRLVELFCPHAESWRVRTMTGALDLIERSFAHPTYAVGRDQ